jgi:hypothetical protein
MTTTPTVFGREPALWISAIAALLGVLVGFGFSGLTGHMAAAIIAVVNAAFGVWIAVRTRPVSPAVFTTLATAGFALLAAYGFDAGQQQIATVNVLVLAMAAFLTRQQVSPAHDVDPKVLGPSPR